MLKNLIILNMMLGHRENKFLLVVICSLFPCCFSCKTELKLGTEKNLKWLKQYENNTSLDIKDSLFLKISLDEYRQAFLKSDIQFVDTFKWASVNNSIVQKEIVIDDTLYQDVGYLISDIIKNYYLVKVIDNKNMFTLLYDINKGSFVPNSKMSFSTIFNKQQQQFVEFSQFYSKEELALKGFVKIASLHEDSLNTIYYYEPHLNNNWVGLKPFIYEAFVYMIYQPLFEDGFPKDKSTFVKINIKDLKKMDDVGSVLN